MSHQQSLHWRRFRRAELADPRIPPQYPPDLELEPVHLDIDLHVDVAGETAVGTVTTTVVARGPNPQTLELNAVDFADVSVVDPAGRDLSHDYDGSRIRIRWDQPFTAGEERRVAVSYRVTSPVDGLYFSNPDAAYPNETRYASTDHETERAPLAALHRPAQRAHDPRLPPARRRRLHHPGQRHARRRNRPR